MLRVADVSVQALNTSLSLSLSDTHTYTHRKKPTDTQPKGVKWIISTKQKKHSIFLQQGSEVIVLRK